ncbi:hypothetical protein B0H13DRAFT_2018415, partial [Mycena leptocephala]
GSMTRRGRRRKRRSQDHPTARPRRRPRPNLKNARPPRVPPPPTHRIRIRKTPPTSTYRPPRVPPSRDSAWPEWSAPAWAAHRFDEDEGWEGACDGVQDVVFAGETDPRHGAAWHHYEYSGR